ncbi:MAG: VanZ family protein [Bacteroidales bacterium]|jgi:glycopeptide antibiotics resistance protein|nr:VanZ family protein [Bacteroidales bacterium]
MQKFKKWGVFFFICYALMVLLFNTLPFDLSQKINEALIGEFRIDYLSHSLIFLPWTIFRCLFCRKSKWIWFILGFGFALAIEGGQYFLPYRSFNWYDMIFNVLGLVLGYLVFFGLNIKIEEYFDYRKQSLAVEKEEEA